MKSKGAFEYGLLSIGLLLAGILLSFFWPLPQALSSGICTISIGLGIGALVIGKKELRMDSKNRKSKIGMILGIVVLSMQVISFVVVLFLVFV